MNKTMRILLFPLLFSLLPAPATWAQRALEPEQEPEGLADEERRTHRLDALPDNIRAALRDVAPDIVLQEAESFWERDYRVYLLRGRLMREVWYVYIRDDGRVLNVVSDFVGD